MMLPRSFYEQDTITVAKSLLGQILVSDAGGMKTSGIIVETEAYMGESDPAAHSYKGKTERVAVQYGSSGTAYVYLIYGMYCCMNITSGPFGKPEVVLIRALQPLDGIDVMCGRRNTRDSRKLCSGPGKLCMALSISRSMNGCDLCSETGALHLESGMRPDSISSSKRVNIDYAGSAADLPWRFTIDGNDFVSR